MTAGTHEHYETLIEKRLHGELADDEAADLASHVETCAACRAYLHQAEKENTMLEETAQSAAVQCDYKRIQQAIVNQTTVYRYERVISRIMIAAGFVTAGVFAALRIWHGAIVALLVTSAMILFVQYRSRRMHAWDELAQRAKSGDETAYGEYVRQARFQLSLFRFFLAFLVVIVGFAAIEHVIEGRWLMAIWLTATWLMVTGYAAWQIFYSPRRRKEEAFIEGRITSDDYLIGKAACDSPDESTADRRSE